MLPAALLFPVLAVAQSADGPLAPIGRDRSALEEEAASESAPAAASSARTTVTGPAERFRLPPGKSVVLSFVAQDGVSGVDDVYVRVNDGPYTRNAARRLELRGDGFYVIRWYTVDRAGNRGAENVRAIEIDSKAPQLQFSVAGSPIGPKQEVAARATLALLAMDAGVGVESLQWRRNAADAWQPYVSPLPLKDLAGADGRGLIQFRALDRLQNESPVESFVYVIDNTPPALPRLFGDPPAGQIVRLGAEGIRFPAVEPGARLEYKLNDDNYTETEEGARIFIDQDGPATFEVKVTDFVGNSQSRRYQLLVDTEAPTTELQTAP